MGEESVVSSEQVEGYPIALLVDILDRVVDDAVMEALAGAGNRELTLAHGTVFEMIDPGGSRVVDMARRARMSKQGMGQLVAAVEDLGYVERRPDPSDGRAQLVHLTRRGRRAAEEGMLGMQALELRWREQLGARRYEDVRRALATLVLATGTDHVR